MQHEQLDAREAAARLDGRRARVAGRGPDDGAAALPSVEKMLEERSEELQREVLEGERRAVEELHEPKPLVELGQRGDRRVVEACVGPLDQPRQGGALGRRPAETDDDLQRKLGVAAAGEPPQRVAAHRRPRGGHIEAAVRRQSAQSDVVEGYRRDAAACADVVQGCRRSALARRPARPPCEGSLYRSAKRCRRLQ